MMFYPIRTIAAVPCSAPTSIPSFNKFIGKESLSKICNNSNVIMPKTAAIVKRLVIRNGSIGGSKPNN
jgi:hypothetical protein